MKNRSIITLIAFVLWSSPASAQNSTSDGFAYTSDGTAVTITNYTGAGGAVAIPASIGGLPVTTVGVRANGDSAFTGVSTVTSVSIPSSVTTINPGTFGVFHGCTSLTSISVNASNTAFATTADGRSLINKAGNRLVQFVPGFSGGYVIPNGIVTIGVNAFRGCASLTGITIPTSVTSTEYGAFLGCSGLTAVTLPESMTTLGDGSFDFCTSLTSLTVPGTIKHIGNSTFASCFNLVSVSLGEGVTGIGNFAFTNCQNLTTIRIPSTITSVGVAAFQNCAALGKIYFPGNAPATGENVFLLSGLTKVFYRNGAVGWGSTLGSLPTEALSAPAITVQPANQTIAFGGTAIFAATATGGGLEFQWRRNGAPINGATNSILTINDAQSGVAGYYDVVVSNFAGSIASSLATLDVRGYNFDSWTSRNLTYSFYPRAAWADANGFILVGYGAGIITSSDGITWVQRTANLNNTYTLCAIARGAGRYVVAGQDGAIITSVDGINWTVVNQGTSGWFFGLTWTGSQFIAVGHNGMIKTSPDGLTWTDRNSGVTSQLVGVVSNGSRIVIAAQDRTLLSSSDGINWSRQSISTPGGLNAVCWANGLFVVVGDYATLATSPDGLSWTVRSNLPSGNFGGLTWGGGQFIASGWNGLIATSPDGLSWTPHSTGSTVQLTGIATNQTTVIAVGYSATFLTAGLDQRNAPVITAQPQSQSATTPGGNFTFSVSVLGTPSPTLQWYYNGAAIPGATNATLTLSAVQATAAGNYWVVATNSTGSVRSSVATFSLTQPGNNAAQSFAGLGFVPGQTLTLTNTLTYSGTASALSWSALLPSGWTFASSGGSVGDQGPVPGTVDVLDWAWTTIPPSPVVFTYTLTAPSNASGPQEIVALAGVRNGNSLQFLAQPDPLIVPQVTTHTADIDGNYRLSLLELTRVIELFNTRYGATRTGCYAVATTTTDDGFTSDASRASTTAVALSRYHAADSNRDGKIGLLELTRVIELYNYRSGTTRIGQYHPQAGTEDSFAPGP